MIVNLAILREVIPRVIQKGDATAIRSIIAENRIDVNADIGNDGQVPFYCDDDFTGKVPVSYTLLHKAVSHNQLHIVQLLVELGADITIAGKTIIYVDGGWTGTECVTPLEQAVCEGHTDIVYYLRKTCNQNISQFMQDFQTSINITVQEYERTHPERNVQSLLQTSGQHMGTQMKINRQEGTQQIQQIQQIVEQLQVTMSTEQQKSETHNQELRSEIQALKSDNERIQAALSAEQQKSNALLDRIKTLEDTVERLWTISRDEVQLSRNILGTGGWGYVKEATFRGRIVAAKCLHEAIVSPHNQELFAKEMKISARCRHKNLIEFIGAVPDHPAIIVTEIMDCTLRLALTNGRATPNHIHPISIDVAQGLVYLHGIQPNPIIHRDVSAPNVLLKAVSAGWIAKLSDLGSAQFANLAKTLAPGCFLYAAPEVQQRDSAGQQTAKMDVFSYGVLLIEILTRDMPTGTIDQLIATIQPLWPHFVPLIQNCTNADPTRRPTMQEVMRTLNTVVI